MQNHGWTHGQDGVDPIPNWPSGGSGGSDLGYCFALMPSIQTIASGTPEDLAMTLDVRGSDFNGDFLFDVASSYLQILTPPTEPGADGGLYQFIACVQWDAFAGDRYAEITLDTTAIAGTYYPSAVPHRVRGADSTSDEIQVVEALFRIGSGGGNTFPADVKLTVRQASGSDRDVVAASMTAVCLGTI